MENKYLLFLIDSFYPEGGWNDFEGTFETLELAKEYLDKNHLCHDLSCHIVYSGEIILSGSTVEEVETRKDGSSRICGYAWYFEETKEYDGN